MSVRNSRRWSNGGALRRDPERLFAFGAPVPDPDPRVGDIVKAAARVAGVTRAHFTSGCRERALVFPRQCAMWIAVHATVRSLPEIGRRFGDRDHTTVLHAARQTDDRLAAGGCESRVRETIAAILTELAGLPLLPEAHAAALPVSPSLPATVAAPCRSRKVVRSPGPEDLLEASPGSRRWFERNDALFRAAFAAAHPERVVRAAVPA